jgi:hypothetical protein
MIVLVNVGVEKIDGKGFAVGVNICRRLVGRFGGPNLPYLFAVCLPTANDLPCVLGLLP